MKSSETPEAAIIRLYKKDLSPYEIRKRMGAGYTRINKPIEECKITKEIPKSKKTGSPPKSTPEVLRFVSEKTYENRFQSCKDISEQLKEEKIGSVSPSSVYHYKKQLKFEFIAPNIRQFLSHQNVEERLLFSNSWLSSNNNSDLIVFSDESRFCQMNDNTWCWMKRGDTSDDVY